MKRLIAFLMVAAGLAGQTYNIVTIVPNAGATAVGKLRWAEKSNAPSRKYLSFEGPDTLGADVVYRFDGTTTAGCLQLGAASGGVNTITTTTCGLFPIVFPSGTAAPQIDATGLAGALNVNGASTGNGNIVLNPGAVAGNASVFINTPRTDLPGLIVKNHSGVTTGNVWEIQDSAGVAAVRVVGSGAGGGLAPSSLFVGLASTDLGLVGPSVVAQDVIASVSATSNASGISIAATPGSGGADVSVFKTGSGTLLPLRFYRNPNEVARFDTSNRFLIARTSDDGTGAIFQVDGDASVSGTIHVGGCVGCGGASLPLAGGTMTGDILVSGSHAIGSSGTPWAAIYADVFTATTGFASLSSASNAVNIPNGGVLAVNGTFGVSPNYIVIQNSSPQIDAGSLGAAFNFNGASATNGNIVLNPGNVTGLSSVQINGHSNGVSTQSLIINEAGAPTGSGISMKHGGTFDAAWQAGSSAAFDVVDSGSSHRFVVLQTGLVLVARTSDDGTGAIFQVNGAESVAAGKFVVDANGKVTTYNNAVLAGIGLVPVTDVQSATGVTANTSTNLLVGGGTPPAGMYRVHLYVLCRSAGTGNVLMTLDYTDSLGQVKSQIGGIGGLGGFMSLTSGQYAPLIFLAETNGSAITLSITYTSSGSYDYYVVLERLT